MNLKNINLLFLFFTNVNAFIRIPNRIRDINMKYSFSCDCSEWNGKCIDALIFKGGGSRAIVYSGAVKKLEENCMIYKVKNLAGTSSGAQTAGLLCCGYNSKELEQCLKYAPWDKILDRGFLNLKSIYSLIFNYGLYDSSNLQNYIEELIENKTGIANITFKQLYELSNIHLKVGVCSLTDKKFKYIDYIDYPDMPVSLGLTASSSIPIIFSTTKWKNEYFVDGGLIGNLPITAFPDNNCLAFNLINSKDINKIEENPKNILDFIKILFFILFNYAQQTFSPKNTDLKNIEYIEIFTKNVKLLDTNIKNKTIDDLVNFGYMAVENFLR